MKQWLLFFLLLVLFFADLFLLSLFQKQTVYLLVCLYVCQLYSHSPAYAPLALTALLVGLESFVLYGQFGLQLVYLLPATIIALQAKKSFYAPKLQPYLLLVLCIGAHALLLDNITPAFTPIAWYTKSQIPANLLVLWCMIHSLNRR